MLGLHAFLLTTLRKEVLRFYSSSDPECIRMYFVKSVNLESFLQSHRSNTNTNIQGLQCRVRSLYFREFTLVCPA